MGYSKQIYMEQLSLFDDLDELNHLHEQEQRQVEEFNNAHVYLIQTAEYGNVNNEWMLAHGTDEELAEYQQHLVDLPNVKFKDVWKVGEDYKFWPRAELIAFYNELKGNNKNKNK